MKPYSLDLRERVIATLKTAAYTQEEVAELYGVSLSWVEKLWHRYQNTDSYAALPPGGGRERVLARFEDLLRRMVERQPDVTLEELRARLRKRKRPVKVSVSMLHRELDRLGLPRKKKSLYDSQRDTPRVKKLRRNYLQEIAEVLAAKFKFIDETGVHLGYTRLYGRAPAGERVCESTPTYPGQHYTVVAVLGLQGVQAPLVFAGAMTGDIFVEYLRVQVAPTLTPGDVVTFDNLSAHKRAEAKAIIEACGARVQFLSPYSADFNPIELVWAKAKQALRTAKARTLNDLVAALADALHAITEQDAHAFFQHCGYTVH